MPSNFENPILAEVYFFTEYRTVLANRKPERMLELSQVLQLSGAVAELFGGHVQTLQ